MAKYLILILIFIACSKKPENEIYYLNQDEETQIYNELISKFLIRNSQFNELKIEKNLFVFNAEYGSFFTDDEEIKNKLTFQNNINRNSKRKVIRIKKEYLNQIKPSKNKNRFYRLSFSRPFFLNKKSIVFAWSAIYYFTYPIDSLKTQETQSGGTIGKAIFELKNGNWKLISIEDKIEI